MMDQNQMAALEKAMSKLTMKDIAEVIEHMAKTFAEEGMKRYANEGE